jgi:hypothetical protein
MYFGVMCVWLYMLDRYVSVCLLTRFKCCGSVVDDH